MDREKVIRAVDSCFDYWLDQNKYLHPLELEHVRQIKADALTLLKEQDAKTGYWIDTTKVIGFPRVQCSVCGSEQGAIWMDYCPICGAKMKGR